MEIRCGFLSEKFGKEEIEAWRFGLSEMEAWRFGLSGALCVACGSNAGDGTEHRLGAWLMLTCFQTSVITSAMFLTAMAANPLCATLTQNSINQTIGWLDWANSNFNLPATCFMALI